MRLFDAHETDNQPDRRHFFRRCRGLDRGRGGSARGVACRSIASDCRRDSRRLYRAAAAARPIQLVSREASAAMPHCFTFETLGPRRSFSAARRCRCWGRWTDQGAVCRFIRILSARRPLRRRRSKASVWVCGHGCAWRHSSICVNKAASRREGERPVAGRVRGRPRAEWLTTARPNS
jgi:hypothetical protein